MWLERVWFSHVTTPSFLLADSFSVHTADLTKKLVLKVISWLKSLLFNNSATREDGDIGLQIILVSKVQHVDDVEVAPGLNLSTQGQTLSPSPHTRDTVHRRVPTLPLHDLYLGSSLCMVKSYACWFNIDWLEQTSIVSFDALERRESPRKRKRGKFQILRQMGELKDIPLIQDSCNNKKRNIIIKCPNKVHLKNLEWNYPPFSVSGKREWYSDKQF